ncbi:hypothetical protein EVA_18678 [gut metagenome]|uniref:Uncharacterized protein n=1 Tax=gut metagenome TaxID=749906 RepID=J9FE77_9ZZZZ
MLRLTVVRLAFLSAKTISSISHSKLSKRLRLRALTSYSVPTV